MKEPNYEEPPDLCLDCDEENKNGGCPHLSGDSDGWAHDGECDKLNEYLKSQATVQPEAIQDGSGVSKKEDVK